MDDLDDELLCPSCHSLNTRQQSQIGVLRDREVHRCRYCGMVWNHHTENEPE